MCLIRAAMQSTVHIFEKYGEKVHSAGGGEARIVSGNRYRNAASGRRRKRRPRRGGKAAFPQNLSTFFSAIRNAKSEHPKGRPNNSRAKMKRKLFPVGEEERNGHFICMKSADEGNPHGASFESQIGVHLACEKFENTATGAAPPKVNELSNPNASASPAHRRRQCSLAIRPLSKCCQIISP